LLSPWDASRKSSAEAISLSSRSICWCSCRATSPLKRASNSRCRAISFANSMIVLSRSRSSLPPTKQYPTDARVTPDETSEGNPEQPIVYCHAGPPSNGERKLSCDRRSKIWESTPHRGQRARRGTVSRPSAWAIVSSVGGLRQRKPQADDCSGLGED